MSALEGLGQKYIVLRLNDEVGKHDACEFFVLDLEHDRHTQPALRAYADSVESENPSFASELRELADTFNYTEKERDR